MSVYVRIKELREEKGLTQYELATRIGVQVNAVQKYEYQKNKSIPFSTLEKLCEVLECTPTELLEIKKDG